MFKKDRVYDVPNAEPVFSDVGLATPLIAQAEPVEYNPVSGVDASAISADQETGVWNLGPNNPNRENRDALRRANCVGRQAAQVEAGQVRAANRHAQLVEPTTVPPGQAALNVPNTAYATASFANANEVSCVMTPQIAKGVSDAQTAGDEAYARKIAEEEALRARQAPQPEEPPPAYSAAPTGGYEVAEYKTEDYQCSEYQCSEYKSVYDK